MNADRPLSSTRLPAVAGSFYPSDPQELRDSIGGLLTATPLPEAVVELRLLIVPHAGYAYSGPVAATAYRLLQALDGPRRVVVVGPSHFVHFFGLATPGVENFTTPLGVVPVDADLTARAEFHSSVGPNRTAHEREHSIEVQLPFLQVVLKEFTVVALLTGSVEPTTVAEVLGALMDDEGVVGLVSSDLSHYLDYDAARVRDERTARAMMEKRPEQLARGAACGRVGVQAALLLARQEGWVCSLLDLRSSGDTAGRRDVVVGYGAFAIGPLR
jgi:AmmeMemoRadiSam system protein B